MKLNYEALRQLMIEMQNQPPCPSESTIVSNVVKKGFSQNDAIYSLKQAIDAGLIDGSVKTDFSNTYYFDLRDITPAGHQFIDSILEDTYWNKVKTVIKEEGIPVTIPSITRTIAKLFL